MKASSRTLPAAPLTRKAAARQRSSLPGGLGGLLEQAVAQASETVVITDAAGVVEWANPALERVTGYTPAEAVGRHIRFIASGQHDQAFYQRLWAELLAGRSWKGVFVNRRKDGSVYREEATISPVLDPQGVPRHYVAIKRDLSEEESLRAQLLQAQKLESVGRLAGGVAHDFNNLLTGILGFGGLVKQQLPAGSPAADDLEQLLLSSERAVSLTRQLLVFSRKHLPEPRPVELGELVVGVHRLLRRLVHANVDLRVETSADGVWAFADPGHLEQVLVNLVVNAQDAMPTGGPLVVRAQARRLEGPRAWRRGGVPGGEWAVLEVSDGGCGMTEHIQAQLFQPFFTTKAPGQGTGLGLATVLRIAEEGGGQVEVDSRPGQGTTVTLWLPLLEAGAARRELARCAVPDPELTAGGAGRVWLVEDDPDVRSVSARALRDRGFSVEAFGSAEAALRVAADARFAPELLVADAMLPGLGGAVLAQALRRLWPGLEVLFVSGYDAGEPGLENVAPERVLRKPFGAGELVGRVLELLGQEALN